MLRRYVDASVVIVVCAILSALTLLLCCAVDGVWWPMFNLLFYILILVPPYFGSLDSTELFGSISDFFAAASGLSLFAFPIVLYRAEVIYGAALFFAFLSNVFAAISIFLYLKERED